jgi:hypothetical protein
MEGKKIKKQMEEGTITKYLKIECNVADLRIIVLNIEGL